MQQFTPAAASILSTTVNLLRTIRTIKVACKVKLTSTLHLIKTIGKICHCLNVVVIGKSLKFILRNTVLFLYMPNDKLLAKTAFIIKTQDKIVIVHNYVRGLSSIEVKYNNQIVIEEELCYKLNYGGRLKIDAK